jgi:hypothetical protein
MNLATLSLRLNTSLNTTCIHSIVTLLDDNMNHIWTAKNKLYLGNIRAANDKKLLREHKIGAVLSVIDTSELCMDPHVVKLVRRMKAIYVVSGLRRKMMRVFNCPASSSRPIHSSKTTLREPTCWCIVMQASLDQQVW